MTYNLVELSKRGDISPTIGKDKRGGATPLALLSEISLSGIPLM